MRAQFRTRIRIVLTGIVLITILIIGRLYMIQIVQGNEYAARADRQFSAGGSGLFDRGSIYFTHKDGTEISAATLVTGFLVAINPQTLKDPEHAYAAISRVASTSVLTKDEFMAATKKESRVYIEVAHHLSDEAGKSLVAEATPGVQVLRERWRYYPGGPLASHAIGIVSYGSGDTLAGRTGVEAHYDAALARTGNSLYKNFFAQLFSNIGDLLVDAQNAREGDIITTIEPEVQTRLMEDLEKVSRQYGSRESGGIIMDPRTGAIIAMASYPSYDPNDLANADPKQINNPLVERVHEFGSIAKPLTVAAGLDVGAITPSSSYYDTGCTTINTREICNWDLKARGTVGVKQIIVQSLNLGAAWVAGQIGQEQFRNYFTKLFGEKTGIDQPNEGRSLIANLKTREQVNYATASYGQGIAVTPVQMIRAQGALANGGVMVEPHLVSAMRLHTGIERTIPWDKKVPVFSAEAVRATTEMMTEVVDTKLLEGKAKIPTMSVAAKTGTAQLTDGQGGYYKDRFFHSFVGYFPAYAPRYIILLYTHDPHGVQYASETLSKTFLDLTHFLIEYYAIPPDRGLAEAAP
jgi:cell division protein FtsI/penicillin-binding protein 2